MKLLHKANAIKQPHLNNVLFQYVMALLQGKTMHGNLLEQDVYIDIIRITVNYIFVYENLLDFI